MQIADIGDIIIQIVAFLMAISFHECAHAWAAKKLGDPTGEVEGRLTLNPAAHIDPVGTILLPMMALLTTSGRFFIGWAKPVPINIYNFKNPKQGMIWSAVAGPAMNLALAVAGTFLLKLVFALGFNSLAIEALLESIILVNVGLAVFNMLPIPPLDGGHVLLGLLPREQANFYRSIEPYGFFIILGLSYFGVLRHVLYYPTYAILRLLSGLF